MKTLKIYTSEKKQALRLAKQKVTKLADIDGAIEALAKKVNISTSTILSYKYGGGNNFETALRIIEG